MPDADVYQGEILAAHLDRTPQGTRLTFVEDVPLANGFLATTLPNRPWEGADLPSFFLNLLPEGARLQLLLESARSRDDPLELLLRVGWDTVGDVAVLPSGQRPEPEAARVSARALQDVRFWDMFYASVGDRADAALPGAQEKISASTVAFGVRTAAVPSAILKLNPSKYPRLVQNEAFFLQMAKACGLRVNAATVVHDQTGEPGLLVTRFDRFKNGRRLVKRHQEDGCQLLDLPPARKYGVSWREVADAIGNVCTAPIVETERLLRLIAFSYLIGNGDLHAKNVSVLWESAVRLSPAYDLLSTLPYQDDRMALKLQGKDDNLRPGDFVDFGRRYELPERAILRMIGDVCDRAEPWIARLEEIGFDEKTTVSLERRLRARLEQLR